MRFLKEFRVRVFGLVLLSISAAIGTAFLLHDDPKPADPPTYVAPLVTEKLKEVDATEAPVPPVDEERVFLIDGEWNYLDPGAARILTAYGELPGFGELRVVPVATPSMKALARSMPKAILLTNDQNQKAILDRRARLAYLQIGSGKQQEAIMLQAITLERLVEALDL